MIISTISGISKYFDVIDGSKLRGLVEVRSGRRSETDEEATSIKTDWEALQANGIADVANDHPPLHLGQPSRISSQDPVKL